MKPGAVVRNYYVLPCLLLLLNLVNNIVSYKAGMIADPFLRTSAVMMLVLGGSSVTAFLVAPALEKLVQVLHRTSRRGAGGLGEAIFLVALGVAVFWLYYRVSSHGAAALLPAEWRNSAGH
jgi:hypothetical protein